MERLAYINIEPNNGGIVLNVCEEGLCFHAIGPVERNGKLHFSLLKQNRRIEADGQLAWMDDAQKVGGLRFATLPSEAREQIEDWISEPSTPLVDGVPSTFAALPRAFDGQGTGPSSAAAAPAPARAPVLYGFRVPSFLRGFSGGLAIGLVVAALVATGFLFYYHRHQVGESLIQIGQRLAGKPDTRAAVLTQANPAGTSQGSPAQGAAASAPSPTSQAAATRETTKPGSEAAEDSTSEKSTSSSAAPLTVAANPKSKMASSKMTASMAPPSLPLSNSSGSNLSELVTKKDVSLPQLAGRSNVQAVESGSSTNGAAPRMYLEVGKFKRELWARKATDELAQLGFPATISQKSGLWRRSYLVLVGPYADKEEVKSAHKDLAARGFKPRAFERGSRDFILSSHVTLNGTRIPVGDFVISWESYLPDARVNFSQNDFVVASGDAKWVDRGSKNERNAFVYQRRPDGSHLLLELRFAGMSKVLVFANPS